MPCSEEQPCDPRIVRSRSKVLEAATELLVEHGARAVTVDAVAEQSGVAKSTIYRHWDSRTALLVDVIRSHIPVIEVPTSGSFADALAESMRQLAAAMSTPEWARIMPNVAALRASMSDVAELNDADHAEKLMLMRRVLQLGVDEGRFPPLGTPGGLDELDTMHMLVGPLMMASIGGFTDSLGALADRATEQFLAMHPMPDRTSELPASE